jgi:hypothetical protein
MGALSVEGTSKMQPCFSLALAAGANPILLKPRGTLWVAGLATRGAPDGVAAGRPRAGSIGAHLTGI